MAFFSVSSYGETRFHIFLDLDETLVDGIRCDLDSHENEVAGYQVVHGAKELIYILARMPQVRLSFLSRGPQCRNKRLLEKMILQDGRSAFETVEGRVYSREDIKPQNNYEKDLTQFVNAQDLPNAILVDDHLEGVPLGQKKNVLWVPQPKEMPADDFGHKDQVSIPFVIRRWTKYSIQADGLQSQTSARCLKDSNRIIRVMGLLIKAMGAVKEGQSLVDVLSTLQWNGRIPQRDHYQWNLLWDLELFKLGIEAFSRLYPDYQPIAILPHQMKEGNTVFEPQIQKIYDYISSISAYQHLVFLPYDSPRPFFEPLIETWKEADSRKFEIQLVTPDRKDADEFLEHLPKGKLPYSVYGFRNATDDKLSVYIDILDIAHLKAISQYLEGKSYVRNIKDCETQKWAFPRQITAPL